MMKITYAAIAAMICAALLAFSQPATAAPLTWDGGGVDSNWGTADNWSPNQTPVGGDTLIFTAPTSNLKFSQTNDLTAGTQINGFTFSNAVGGFFFSGNKINLGGNITNSSTNGTGNQTFNFAIDLVGGNRTISANNGRIVTIAGSIGESGGSYGLTVTNGGSGVVYLDGANTYSGPTAVTAGFLALRNSGALGNSSGATASSGATLQLENNISVTGVNATINGTGVSGTRGALASWSGTNSWSGGVTLASNSSILVNAGSLTLSGAIGETGGARVLTKTGAGTLTLSGAAANTNTGTTIVAHVGSAAFAPLVLNKTAGVNALGGDLQIGNSGGGYATVELGASNQIADSATITFAGTVNNWSYFKMLGRNETVAGLNSAANGVLENMEGEVINTNSTLTLGGAGTYSYTGYIRDKTSGAGTGTIGITQSGTGTQTLAGANVAYTGATVVNDGRLVLSNTTAFRSNTTIASGGTLEMAVSSGTLTVPVSYTISGAGTLVKSGAGNWTIGANGIQVTMAMSAGWLNDIQGGVLQNNFIRSMWTGNQASLNIAGGATLDMFSDNVFVNALTGAGTVQNGYAPNGVKTLTVGVAGGSGTFSGAIVGSGGNIALTKSGAGTQTLTGANTYGGATTISGGTLQIGGAGQLNAGAYAGAIANSGTFKYSSSAAQTLSGAITGTGALVKDSANSVLTLSNAGTNYTGATTVSQGTLKLTNATGFRSATSVSSGATLELNATAGWIPTSNWSISGTGTVVKSGSGQMDLTWTGSQFVAFNLGAGALIDVQGGSLRHGNGYDDTIWENNLASLNVANGAKFDVWDYGATSGKSVRVNALTGAGTVDKGWGGTGTLIVGVANGSGTFSGTIQNVSTGNGASILNLVKNGTGTQTLSGTSTYTGTTTVNGGTLRVNGAHTNAGAYFVNNGGTLGGAGSITTNNASITVAAGGKLSPGASPGTLTLNLGSGTLNLSGISTGALVFELGPIGANDQVVLNSGTLNIGTLNFDEFNFIALTGTSLGTYKLFDSANPISGALGVDSGFFSGGRWGGYLWLDNGNRDVMLTLDFTSVPEPSTLLLAALGAVGLAWRFRRLRRPHA